MIRAFIGDVIGVTCLAVIFAALPWIVYGLGGVQ